MAQSRSVHIGITVGPPYSVTFGGPGGSPSAKIHKNGHLWLWQDSPGFTITFEIYTPGFVFANSPIYIGSDPSPSGYRDFGGVFKVIGFSNGDASLDLWDQNSDHKKYFYQLNFLDSNNTQFSTPDPIIVNN
jgi:hypothetical protein